MDRKTLTDRTLKALKPAPAGHRYEIYDAVVPNLGVRVGPKNANGKFKRTFVVLARFNGKNPTRRAIGHYGAVTLVQAREKARHWLELVGGGKDPKVEAERERKAERRKQANTFAAAAEAYFETLDGKRTAYDIKRDIRRVLITEWGDTPVTDITRQDVRELIQKIAKRTPSMAHLMFAYTRAMFGWICEEYDIDTSPCDRIKPKKLIGEKKPRTRVLNDTEIAALWRATDQLDYPFGPMFRLLMLTGTRLSEAAGARWSEIEGHLWTVPAERFKTDLPHLVPLTDQTIALIKALPRFAGGDCLFSTTSGKKPVSGFSKGKARLDALMTAEIDAPKPWRTHDIRRTVRTGLARLNVSDTVAELVIGHGKQGLQKVYNQHSYEPQMREALEKWAGALRDIVTPPPENVLKMLARA